MTNGSLKQTDGDNEQLVFCLNIFSYLTIPSMQPDLVLSSISDSKNLSVSNGFSMIELLITIAILGILLSLAIPSFTEFVNASKGSSISTEFVSDMTRARSEAISSNTCVKICQSANADSGKAATCATSGDDWQRGWILFRLPSCDSTTTDPVDSDVLAVRFGQNPDFMLNGGVYFFMFDPRGVSLAGAIANLNLKHLTVGSTTKHNRTICVSFAGRVTVRDWETSCSS